MPSWRIPQSSDAILFHYLQYNVCEHLNTKIRHVGLIKLALTLLGYSEYNTI